MDEIAHYHSVLNADSRDIEAHQALSKLQKEAGDLTRASSHALIAARLLAAAGRLGEAIDACQGSIQMRSGDTEAHMLLANLFARRPSVGHTQRVVEVLERPSRDIIAEPLIILSPADAVEELFPEEIEILSTDEAALAPEELDELPNQEDQNTVSTVEITDPADVLSSVPRPTSLAATLRAARNKNPKPLPETRPEIPELDTGFIDEPADEAEETVLLSLDEIKEELKDADVEVTPAALSIEGNNDANKAYEPSTEELELDDIHILNTGEMKALDLQQLRDFSSKADAEGMALAAAILGPNKDLDPRDVLQVIDASDDSFLRGHPPMLFTSGESSMSSLGVFEPPSVPGLEASMSGSEPNLSSLDGFEAIADLIQDSLDASLGDQDELSGEFGTLSKVDIHSQEPPVPGWSKRPPEAKAEPAKNLVVDNPQKSLIDLETLLRDPSEPPSKILRLIPGEAGELLERLAPGQHERLKRWLRRRRFPAGSLALREGVPHQSLFLIESGEIVFERRIAAGRQPVASMGAGGVFGEFELLLRRPPRVQARASKDSVLFELTERALTDLSITASSLWTELWVFYQERLVRSFLEHGSLFHSLTDEDRIALLDAFEPMVCEEGESIIKQGSPGAGLYLISAGEVMVSHQQQERHTIVANLREGNFFCSMLHSSTPITASVEARGETRLMVLPREVLEGLVADHASIREALARLVSYRQIVVGKTNYSRIGIPG